MSRYLCHHRGSGRQLWQTQHAALTQHYQPTRWQKHYDRWQHVDQHNWAEQHRVQYASWLCWQQVDQLSETWRYQQSETTYQQATKIQWVGQQAHYRYRIATWQQRIKQTWSWHGLITAITHHHNTVKLTVHSPLWWLIQWRHIGWYPQTQASIVMQEMLKSIQHYDPRLTSVLVVILTRNIQGHFSGGFTLMKFRRLIEKTMQCSIIISTVVINNIAK